MPRSICSIDGCGKAVKGRGYCSMHYQRHMRTGSAGGLERLKAKDGAHASFIRSLIDAKIDACIEWPFGRKRLPYPSAEFEGLSGSVHRILCIRVHGEPATPDLVAAHSCGNDWCVNPGHVRWATQHENILDKQVHGTQFFGESHPLAKITADQAAEIIAIGRAITQDEIARQFGICQKEVSLILRRKRWRSISA